MFAELTSGEWIGIILGIVGIAATIFVGWFFYRKTERQQIDSNEVANKVIALAEQKGKMFIDEDTLKKSLIDAVKRAENLGESGKRMEAEKALEDLRRNGDTARLQTLLIDDREAHKKAVREHAEDLIKRNYEISTIAYLRGDIGISIEAVEEILKLRPNDLNALTQKGQIYVLRGELEQAEKMCKKVLELAENNKDKRWQAAALGNLGIIYWTRGDFNKAEEMYKKALEIAEKISDKGIIASVYNNLGNIYRTRGDLREAEVMYDKTLEVSKKRGDKEKIAGTYVNLGIVYQARGELVKAEEMHNMALEIAEKLDDKEKIAAIYGNLGNIFQTRGDLVKAEQMYKETQEIAEKIGAKETMAGALGGLGNIYQICGKLDKAQRSA
jgi:tetratricopeptide (TPR) repeat protein